MITVRARFPDGQIRAVRARLSYATDPADLTASRAVLEPISDPAWEFRPAIGGWIASPRKPTTKSDPIKPEKA